MQIIFIWFFEAYDKVYLFFMLKEQLFLFKLNYSNNTLYYIIIKKMY